MEEWRRCDDYPDVEVSSLGRLRKADTGKVLVGAQSDEHWKYVTVSLRVANGRKTVAVHRLVASAFHGAPPEGRPLVNHINGMYCDNRPDNLEWVSSSQNQRHAHFNRRRSVLDRIALPVSAFDVPIALGPPKVEREPPANPGLKCKSGPFYGKTPDFLAALRASGATEGISPLTAWKWTNGYIPEIARYLLAFPEVAEALARDARRIADQAKPRRAKE